MRKYEQELQAEGLGMGMCWYAKKNKSLNSRNKLSLQVLSQRSRLQMHLNWLKQSSRRSRSGHMSGGLSSSTSAMNSYLLRSSKQQRLVWSFITKRVFHDAHIHAHVHASMHICAHVSTPGCASTCVGIMCRCRATRIWGKNSVSVLVVFHGWQSRAQTCHRGIRKPQKWLKHAKELQNDWNLDQQTEKRCLTQTQPTILAAPVW